MARSLTLSASTPSSAASASRKVCSSNGAAIVPSAGSSKVMARAIAGLHSHWLSPPDISICSSDATGKLAPVQTSWKVISHSAWMAKSSSRACTARFLSSISAILALFSALSLFVKDLWLLWKDGLGRGTVACQPPRMKSSAMFSPPRMPELKRTLVARPLRPLRPKMFVPSPSGSAMLEGRRMPMGFSARAPGALAAMASSTDTAAMAPSVLFPVFLPFCIMWDLRWGGGLARVGG
mmetsp:Transcript_10739/g.22249  ORF Transcript_10739/g.22249 Transcript_10739/m.22249 type:complete len:237 (+) Transcript_10739:390-1100(+)